MVYQISSEEGDSVLMVVTVAQVDDEGDGDYGNFAGGVLQTSGFSPRIVNLGLSG